MLCKYRHVFGEEKKGFHSWRLFDIAVGDLFFTILLAWIISYISGSNIWSTLLVTFILGIFVHRLFCVDTKINTMIFGKTHVE